MEDFMTAAAVFCLGAGSATVVFAWLKKRRDDRTIRLTFDPSPEFDDFVTLADCPVGMFATEDGELCLKTEYGTNEGRIDAFIVSSGEFFWGSHPQTIKNQRAQLVMPLIVEGSYAEEDPGPQQNEYSEQPYRA